MVVTKAAVVVPVAKAAVVGETLAITFVVVVVVFLTPSFGHTFEVYMLTL